MRSERCMHFQSQSIERRCRQSASRSSEQWLDHFLCSNNFAPLIAPLHTAEHCELVSAVRYGYWFNLACERLYARIDFLLNLAQLVGGSGAVFAVVRTAPNLTVFFSILLATCAAVALLVHPAIKAEKHRAAKSSYIELEAQSWKISTQALRGSIAEIRKNSPSGIALLAAPAYNATVRAIGREDSVRPEHWLAKCLNALA
jgi:hypothetical protein